MLVAKLKYEDSHKGGEYLKGHVIERGAVKANRLMLVNSWSTIKDRGNEGECYACSSVVVEMTVPLLKEITRQILQRQSLYSNGCVLCTPLNRSNYNCGGSGYVEGGRSADLFSWSLF